MCWSVLSCKQRIDKLEARLYYLENKEQGEKLVDEYNKLSEELGAGYKALFTDDGKISIYYMRSLLSQVTMYGSYRDSGHLEDLTLIQMSNQKLPDLREKVRVLRMEKELEACKAKCAETEKKWDKQIDPNITTNGTIWTWDAGVPEIPSYSYNIKPVPGTYKLPKQTNRKQTNSAKRKSRKAK